MAAGKRPSPLGSYSDFDDIEDGTLCRAPSATPGAVGTMSLDAALFPEQSGARARAACLSSACTRAGVLLSNAIVQETGYTSEALPESLALHLRQILLLAGSATPDGAAKIPLAHSARTALSGRELGFDLSRPILSELGLAMLAGVMRDGVAEVVKVLQGGIERAWRAAEPSIFDRGHEVEAAANELARAMGILVRVILQSIISYAQEKSGTNSGRRVVGHTNASPVAGSPGRFAFLERDRELAAWVEANWTDLLEKPKLRRRGHVELLVNVRADEAQKQPRPPQTDESQRDQKTWVAVQLVDESGQPVPNERYRIVLPDGSVKDGNLNELGEVEFDEIDPGSCQISFPNIDGKEWRAA